MKLGLKLPLGGLAQPPPADAAPPPSDEAAAAAGGGGGEEEWDDDDQFGVLQAPAERAAPTYDIKNFAFLNPVVDKTCSEKPFPRREQPPAPPEYIAGKLKVNHKATGKSRSATVSDTSRQAWPRALDTPPDHMQSVHTPGPADTYR
uniref:Uncharacterized protein n=2 Tax=Hemiselmis andersenii TaxID=464988 RepID=A0A6U4K028_HEMAN|mmetsp:Transcript_44586/g.108798  ORF Transcript_44586/g.108798 Transcript_44586/m.108798 type:complete len:147 (+) Transcript_44586:45-485(+)